MANNPLSWEYDLYTSAELNKLPEKEVRTEFNRLRDILHKRYERLSKSTKYGNTPAAKAYRETGLKKLSEITSRDELNKTLTWMAWDIQEGDSSIARLEDEARKAEQIADAYMSDMGSDGEGDEDINITSEDKGKFWQWIKSKYDNAYLPPSDVVDDMVEDILGRSTSEHGKKVIYGQWLSNKRKEGEYKIVRA